MELEEQLKSAVIIESSQEVGIFDINKTALVKFYDFDETEKVTLVSTVEADAKNMRISIESPLGLVLYKSRAGEKKTVSSPDGDYDVEIIELLD
jgi:transcription elongation factor GreA